MTVDAFRRDADWMIRHIMSGILDNTTWTFQDKVGPNGAKGYGTLTIQPLANGDAVTYVKKGATAPATDTHYLFQAAAIADTTNPYDDIYAELVEHPSNSGRIKCYIATSLVATTQALTNFIPVSDPDITLGGLNAQLSATVDVGFGDRVLGKVDGCWIIEWGRLPTGCIIGHASGTPVLGIREYPAPELQGFFLSGTARTVTRLSIASCAMLALASRTAWRLWRTSSAAALMPSRPATPTRCLCKSGAGQWLGLAFFLWS